MKFYVIVRADLSPGAQIAQSCHAVVAFANEHRGIHDHWRDTSNVIVCLQVHDEASLLALAREASVRGCEHAVFREPDFGNAATAVALAPSGAEIVKELRLAGR